MKVKMDDLKMQLDLISAEAEEPNQTVINVREEKTKMSAVKAGLENAIEGSRLSVVKLHAEVDGVEAQFCCSGCHILAEVERGHGSIGEHTLCSHGKSKHNMALTSNMLKFPDQKMLEPPEVLFAGQTPHNR